MINARCIQDLERTFGRRSFLRGLASLAAAAALPWPVTGPGPALASHPPGRGPLSPEEKRVLLAAVEAMVPADGPLGLRDLGVDVVRNVEELLVRISPMAVTGLKGLLLVLERGAFLFTRKLSSFTALSLAERARLVQDLDRHGDIIHQMLFKAIKTLAAAGVYSDPRVQRRIGYPGPWNPDGTPPAPPAPPASPRPDEGGGSR
jgi:hypothetical protein